MKLVIHVHNKAGIVMPTDDRKDYNINIKLEDLDEHGLGITEGTMTVVDLPQPMIVTGFTIEGVNE